MVEKGQSKEHEKFLATERLMLKDKWIYGRGGKNTGGLAVRGRGPRVPVGLRKDNLYCDKSMVIQESISDACSGHREAATPRYVARDESGIEDWGGEKIGRAWPVGSSMDSNSLDGLSEFGVALLVFALITPLTNINTNLQPFVFLAHSIELKSGPANSE